METDPQNQKENEIKVDRKSKIFFSVFAILIVAAVGVTYWRYMVKRDYTIQAQIDCDPTTENCFIWHCDPKSLTPGDECTGVPDNDTWYYKILFRNAKNIPNCDPKDKSCTAYVCSDGEKDCNVEFCTPQNVKKGEECNDPVKYNIDNPPADNTTNTECAPDDQECLDAAAQDNSGECDSTTQDCASVDNNQDQNTTPDSNAQNQNNDSSDSQGATPSQ